MKILSMSMLFVAVIIGVSFVGVIVTIGVVIAVTVFVAVIVHRVKVVRQRRRYGQLFENLYVVSNHPVTNDAVIIDDLSDFIVNAPYRSVMIEKRRQEQHLRDAGNKFFADGIDKEQRIEVVPLMFKHGAHINESWNDFCHRVRYIIMEDRAARHEMLSTYDPTWYVHYHHHQDGTTWSVTTKKNK